MGGVEDEGEGWGEWRVRDGGRQLVKTATKQD